FGCARSGDGTVRCWGSNDFGEGGDSTDLTPTTISLASIATVFGGDGRHICALTGNMGAWCWGRNNFGQIGNGTVSDQPQAMPTQVSALGGAPACTFQR